MYVWIRDSRYFVTLSNGVEFGIDRYGNAYAWHRDDPDEHVGRLVYGVRGAHAQSVEPRALTDKGLPPAVAELIVGAERRGAAPIEVPA